jgi:hypothetical protein
MMKKTFHVSSLYFIASIVILGFFSIPTLSMSAQGGQRMVLTFRSEGSMTVTGIYGPAGVKVNSEGYAYLIAGAKGKFTGAGNIYVTMEFNYPKTGVVSITPLKGEGSFAVVGETEGKFLRFYFKHGSIPCKGEIIVNAPAPMGTQKEPYEDNFDPHVLAPGEQPGVKIELKDGATETFTYGPESYAGGIQTASWKTDFTLDGAELWRVGIEGEEIDTTQSPVRNSRLKNESKELPVAVKYKWQLIGEFTILGKGSAREYYEGQVFSAHITHMILFDQQDLYGWEPIPCRETWLPEDLIGQPIGGKMSGNSVRLKWPEFHPRECYSLIPRKSYLGQLRPHKEFDSVEFIGYISMEELPLVDGQVITGGVSDWLKYKITLTKLNK